MPQKRTFTISTSPRINASTSPFAKARKKQRWSPGWRARLRDLRAKNEEEARLKREKRLRERRRDRTNVRGRGRGR